MEREVSPLFNEEVIKNSVGLKREIENVIDKVMEVLNKEIERDAERREKGYERTLLEEEIKLQEERLSPLDGRVISAKEKLA